MNIRSFATVVYPRRSVEAAIAAFARLGDCTIASATDDATVVESDGDEALMRELANFVLEHAVTERL